MALKIEEEKPSPFERVVAGEFALAGIWNPLAEAENG